MAKQQHSKLLPEVPFYFVYKLSKFTLELKVCTGMRHNTT